MSFLSREALLAAAAQPLPTERLDIPELGGFVYIRGMSGAERDSWEKSLFRGRGTKRTIDTENARARLAVRCVVDEQGQRVFTDADAGALGNLRVDVLQKVFEASQRLSGVSDEDLDDIKKSSETAAGSGSPTS